MSKREIKLLLEDILEAARKILSYTLDMDFNEFINDEKTVDAVVRNFEIIGEAASRIPADFKSVHTGIDWRRIIGFCNRIIHEYFGIDYKMVWKIKEDDVSLLADFVQQAVDDSGRRPYQ
jgi:uncharacterized protein with HEPN domain